nr:hypothetical protein [uncultured Friedmanniella sp.]
MWTFGGAGAGVADVVVAEVAGAPPPRCRSTRQDVVAPAGACASTGCRMTRGVLLPACWAQLERLGRPLVGLCGLRSTSSRRS